MKLSEVSVKRPVAVSMFFLIIILLGVVSLGRLNVDLLPEMNLPMALAYTNYEGVGPEEIENLVSRPLEGVVGTVNGIKTINSYSSQGTSVLFVEFNWGTDMSFAVNQMREKIDLVADALPDGCSKPILMKLDPNMMPIMVLGFGGQMDLATLDKLAKDVVKPRLERVNGVATVDVTGGLQREIRISVVPQRLQAYGLSLSQIVSYLRMENRNTSVGTVEEGLKEQVVRVVGEFKNVQDIENLTIPLPSGGYLRLGEIAKVEDTFKEQKAYVYLDGTPGVQISIQRQTDANTVKVSDAVTAALEEIKKDLPPEATVKVGFDQAQYIRQSINQVTTDAVLGAILAMVVLLLFMRNLRSTLIIGTAIPISIIATFILMYFGGITLNMISLGGLALGIGRMVDDSIVMLENIYRHRQNGYSRIEAALKGANEVGLAVMASTFTSVVVFLPIVFVEGMAAQIFRPMALTVTFALLASLTMSLTLVPMLSSKILKVEELALNGQAGKGIHLITKFSAKWGRVIDGMDDKYRRILHWAINNKKKVVFGTFVLIIVSLAMTPLIGMEFIPKQDAGTYTVNITLPNGTAVRETQRITDTVVKNIHELPEHEWAFYAVGSGGNMFGTGTSSESASITGKLLDKTKRTRTIDQVLDELRAKCADIPGAKIEIAAQSMSISTGTSAGISINLKGDNLEVLNALANTIAQRVKDVPGTREVKTSTEEARPELQVRLNRQVADLYGINATQVSGILNTAVKGETASRLRAKGEETNVNVILDKPYRENVNDLKDLTIVSSTGAQVALSDIADIESAKGPTRITRINQTRLVTVTGDISGRDLRSVTNDIQNSLKDITLPPGVELEFGGANKEMMDSFASLGLALLLAIVLVYMVMAAQYESLLYPFVIMFSMPPTIIGVILSLLVTRRTLNVATFIGIIMLAGIVVSNAIVMVDYINTLRQRDGLSRKDAILQAGPTRLRPILMTALTTVLALFPLVLGLGEGSELSSPMATAVFGGLTFSTLITLVLVPCMYIILEDIIAAIKRRFSGKRKGPKAEASLGGE